MLMKNLTYLAAIALVAFAMPQALFAQQHNHKDHNHGAHDHVGAKLGPNGGTIKSVGAQRIETIIAPKGIMFVVLDADGKAVAFPKSSGSLKLRVGDSSKEYPYQLKPLKNKSIGVGVDLSKVVGHVLHMDVKLNGVASQPISFHTMGKVADGRLSDAVLISLQATCPVSGKKLGSMGKPPKVMVNGKPLFVCCAGCSNRVKSASQQYAAKYYGAKGEQVRPGVFKATLADVKAISAQKLCPVMDEPLGGMGAPLKVNVKGKAVYICCAGCAKKLHAQPDEFLAKLAKMNVKPPVMK